MNASELYRAGQLHAAIESVQQDIRRHPADSGKRVLLSQFLLFDGNLERADKQLEGVAAQAPEMGVGIALLRQLIRGEIARRQFFEEGRSPYFLSEDDPLIRLHLEAAICLQGGESAKAVELLQRAEELANPLSGTCNGESFVELRDLDDLLASVLEVITPNGRYYWINMDTICSLEFHPPEQLHDLVWRRTTATIRNGPEGDIYVPALYSGSHTHDDELIRLGRKTDWSADAPVRGVGQRELLVGDTAMPIMEIEQLTLHEES